MGYQYRRLKEAQIMQRELEKQKRKTPSSRNCSITKTEIKLAFFKDILCKSFPGDHTIWDKIEARKLALVKSGYWTNEGEITDLGYERLIKFLLKERKPT